MENTRERLWRSRRADTNVEAIPHPRRCVESHDNDRHRVEIVQTLFAKHCPHLWQSTEVERVGETYSHDRESSLHLASAYPTYPLTQLSCYPAMRRRLTTDCHDVRKPCGIVFWKYCVAFNFSAVRANPNCRLPVSPNCCMSRGSGEPSRSFRRCVDRGSRMRGATIAARLPANSDADTHLHLVTCCLSSRSVASFGVRRAVQSSPSVGSSVLSWPSSETKQSVGCWLSSLAQTTANA